MQSASLDAKDYLANSPLMRRLSGEGLVFWVEVRDYKGSMPASLCQEGEYYAISHAARRQHVWIT